MGIIERVRYLYYLMLAHLADWWHGEVISRYVVLGKDQAIESGKFGSFTATPVKKIEERKKTGKHMRTVRGYVIHEPYPDIKMVAANGGFIKGNTPTEAVQSMHAVYNIERELESEFGKGM